MAIKEVTDAKYDKMLNILPPRLWLGYGFLVGKPINDRICRVTGNKAATYASFFNAFGWYYEGDPLTVQEFVKFDIHTLPRHHEPPPP